MTPVSSMIMSLFRVNEAPRLCLVGLMIVMFLAHACKRSVLGEKKSTPAISTTASVPVLRPRPVATSILQLIANPERFDGSDVSVGGYLIVEDSGEVEAELHLSPEDALRGLGNGVNVSFARCEKRDKESLSAGEMHEHSRKFVHLYGRFSFGDDDRPGVICSVRKIVDMPDPPEFKLRAICPRNQMNPPCSASLR